MSVSAEQLTNFVSRIETLEAEKNGVRDQIREVYNELAGWGFDKKVVRAVVRERRKKPHARAEERELQEVYESALGMK